MADLSAFPITRRWPAVHPDRIQLYSYPTPNGLKVSIALEELGLPYEAHRVTIEPEDVMSPEFLSLNPNNKIPAIIDPDGPEGRPMGLFESGAILIYLAEKTGHLLPDAPEARYQAIQWLMFQMGGIGPFMGQFGFFYARGGKDIEDPRPRDRYLVESQRLLRVLDERLAGRDWVCDDFSIVDIAIVPWLRVLDTGYEAREVLGWADYTNVTAYYDRFMARDAVQRGLLQPPK